MVGVGNGNPLQYSFLENPHGQRNLVGYSLWDCKESDMTERAHTHTHTHTHFKWFSNVYTASKALTFPRVKGDILLGLVDDSNLALLVQKLCI